LLPRRLRWWEESFFWAFTAAFAILLILGIKGCNVLYTGMDSLAIGSARSNDLYLLSAVIQSLAAMFAIVTAISLGAVQLSSQSLSPRVIPVHLGNRKLWVLASFFALAFVLDVVILGRIPLMGAGWINLGILLALYATLLTIPYGLSTVRLLQPDEVVSALASKVRPESFIGLAATARAGEFEKMFQPLEDVLKRSIELTNYPTVERGISVLLGLLKRRIDETLAARSEHKPEDIPNVAWPFIEILNNVATAANKKDAIEITITVVRSSRIIIETQDMRLESLRVKFREALNGILGHAHGRFSGPMYRKELADLAFEVADATLASA